MAVDVNAVAQFDQLLLLAPQTPFQNLEPFSSLFFPPNPLS